MRSRGEAQAAQVKQVAIGQRIARHQRSERLACGLVGLSRGSNRNAPMASAQTEALKTTIIEIGHARRHVGYRRMHDLLCVDTPCVGHRRLFRLCVDANLSVRRPPAGRTPLNSATKVSVVRSMDFVGDSLANGRRLECLTVADDFSHEAVDIAVDHGISGPCVRRLLDQAALFRGDAEARRTDNGPEFTSRACIASAGSVAWRVAAGQPAHED